MVLTDELITQFINTPQNEELICYARSIKKHHELHVNGKGLQEHLDIIEGIEDEDYISLRRALAKEATVPKMAAIRRIKDKIFSAIGGSVLYNFSSETDKEIFANEIIKNAKNGLSIKDWIQKIWNLKVDIDPNGLVFMEISEDGNNSYPTYKSITDIYDISFDSNFNLEYVIFEPELKKDDTKIYRVVDDEYDYLVEEKKNVISILESKKIPNPWGYVPARFLSTRLDLKENVLNTWINEALVSLDDYLLDYTLYKIYKVKQVIPYVYEYESQCPICEGSRHIEYNGVNIKCNTCGGSGTKKNRNIAEVRQIPIPSDSSDPNLIPPAGYVQPDLGTLQAMENTQDRTVGSGFNAVWGEFARVTDSNRKNVTAYEIAATNKSQEDKLNQISDNAEKIDNFITNALGQFYFPNTYKGSINNYGRIYDTKSGREVWEEYQEGIKNEIPTTELNAILNAYFQTLYKQDPIRLNESLIKLNTKPFYHYTPKQIQETGLPVNDYDYLKNIYFDMFVVEYEKNKKIGLSTTEEVQMALDNYIIEKLKIKNNENN